MGEARGEGGRGGGVSLNVVMDMDHGLVTAIVTERRFFVRRSAGDDIIDAASSLFCRFRIGSLKEGCGVQKRRR